MIDSRTVSFGTKASFGGIDARWVAKLPPLTALEAATGSKPYKVFSPKKTQRMVYDWAARDKCGNVLLTPQLAQSFCVHVQQGPDHCKC